MKGRRISNADLAGTEHWIVLASSIVTASALFEFSPWVEHAPSDDLHNRGNSQKYSCIDTGCVDTQPSELSVWSLFTETLGYLQMQA